MSFIISILAVGLLIALHEAGHFVAARRVGMRVLRYSVGFFHALISWTSKKTGIVYQVGVLPFGGFVQIKGMNPFEEGAYEDPESYQLKAPWRRAAVLLAGPTANLLVAWFLLFLLYLVGHPQYVDEPRVGMVVPDGPADKAGIKVGDRVRTLEGKELATWTDLASGLHNHPGQPVKLEIERNSEQLEIAVTPENKNGVGLIGIGQPQEKVTAPPHIAALQAALKCFEIVSGTIAALGNAISGSGSQVQTVGPVGIVKMAASTLNVGLGAFLALVAYLSLMLFMFNLLPLPALDGGRGILLLYEWISRRRVSPKVDAIVNSIGFLLLIGLLVAMTFKEVFLDS